MSTTSPELPSHWLPTRSSVLTRVPHDLRKAINSAIIQHSAGTYRKMYEYFELAAHKVSFTAFYFYARKLRTAATLAELRRPSSPSSSRTHDVLPDILAENLLDAALDVENLSSHKIARLARAYRTAQLACASRHALATARQKEKKEAVAQDIIELRNVANQLIALDHAQGQK